MDTITPVELPESEGGGWIDTLPPRLYHYTGQKGLLGIFENGCLHCSDAHFLNDSEEIRYSIRLAKPQLRRKMDEVEGDPAEEGLVTHLYQGVDNLSASPPYVFSLSVDGNVLSQWRAYCPREGGYSIGFSASQLRRLADEQGFELVQCNYDEDDQTSAINDLISTTLRSFREDGAQFSSDLLRRHQMGFLASFYRLAARFKSPAFTNEEEWRLVSGPRAANEAVLQFRKGDSTPVPYIEFSLREQQDESPYLPISRIWVGPTPNEELAVRAVEGLARRYISPAAQVSYSGISYRTW